jgi:putative tricarboxylic transport membrane protein
MKARARNWSDIGASLFFFLIGIGTIVGAFKLKIGTPLHPQPGFFPFLGGLLLAVLSFVLMVHGWLGRGKVAEAFGEVQRPAMLVVAMAVYLGILDPLGYVLAAIFMNAVILGILGVKSWKVLTTGSVVLSVGTYLLFVRLLGVELPQGVLEGLWIF